MNRTASAHRRALARDFRDKTPDLGVYTMSCDAGEHCVLRAVRNLDAAMQRDRFELRIGRHRDARLQAAWNRGGEDAVRFEVLEVIKVDPASAADPLDALEAARRKWLGRLQLPKEQT